MKPAALQCPACGTAHPLARIPDEPTFRCGRCGQVLTVPAAARRPGPSGPPPVSTSGTAPPPPPRRNGSGAAPGVTVSATVPARGEPSAFVPPGEPAARPRGVAATEHVDPRPVPEESPSARRPRGAVPSNGAPGSKDVASSASSPSTRRVQWYWRLLAWLVALPLGLVITAIPTYNRLVTKDDLLDVFIGSGLGRYARLGAAVALWALVTALLVELFVEGGRVLARRRSASSPRSAPSTPMPASTPSHPRARTGAGAKEATR